MKSNCRPYLIGENGNPTALERVPLKGSEISEGVLQEMLDRSPAVLPVSRFGSGFGPLISLGREIMNIDNLFIAPTGRLTVVETKLWRNPQATRHVLAQMLDYASRLSSLSYEEFEQRCQAANQSALSSSSSLYQLVHDAFPEEVPEEAEFVDQVQRGLKNGRFLLLVVGDGIREGLEQVLDTLHQQSRLHFTFGLVELTLYREPHTGGMLVVPSVVAHSTEVERAVVTIRGATAKQVEVSVHSGPSEQTPKLTEQEFLDSIKDAEVKRFGEKLFQWARQHARIEIAKSGTSAIVRVPFSTTRTGLILLRMYRTGRVLMTPPRLRKVLDNSGHGDEVLRIAHALKRLYPELELDSSKKQIWPPMHATDLLSRTDKVLEIYTSTIERLQALDPGLEASSMNDESENEEDEDA